MTAELTMPFDASTRRPHPIQTVAVSPDGAFLVTGDTDRMLRVYADSELLYDLSLKSHQPKMQTAERIRSTAFSPDSSTLYVAVGDRVKAIRLRDGFVLWTARSPRLLGFLAYLALGIDVAPDGRVVLTFDNGTIEVRNPSGQRLRVFKDNAAPRWVAFSHDGSQLVGSDGFCVMGWDADSGEPLWKDAHEGRVYKLTASKYEDVFAIRTLRDVRLFRLGHDVPLAKVPISEGLPVMAFHPSRPLLAIGDQHHVRIVNYDGQTLFQADVENSTVLCACFDATGNRALAGFSDGSVSSWALDMALDI